jgi:hypothetical protein
LIGQFILPDRRFVAFLSAKFSRSRPALASAVSLRIRAEHTRKTLQVCVSQEDERLEAQAWLLHRGQMQQSSRFLCVI